MWRYRYRREWLPDDELLARCNALGEDGWSLLGAPVWVAGDAAQKAVGVWRCFFSRAYANKRTVSTREETREVFALSPEEAEVVTIRYVRQGLKVVRVVDAAEPLLGPPDPPPQPVTLGEASAYISAVAAGLRTDTRRRHRWGFNGVAVPKQRDPQRDLPGEDLRKARKAAGLSQRQLALEWGLSRGLIGTIELGHRSCPPELAAWARRQNAAQEQA